MFGKGPDIIANIYCLLAKENTKQVIYIKHKAVYLTEWNDMAVICDMVIICIRLLSARILFSVKG